MPAIPLWMNQKIVTHVICGNSWFHAIICSNDDVDCGMLNGSPPAPAALELEKKSGQGPNSTSHGLKSHSNQVAPGHGGDHSKPVSARFECATDM